MHSLIICLCKSVCKFWFIDDVSYLAFQLWPVRLGIEREKESLTGERVEERGGHDLTGSDKVIRSDFLHDFQTDLQTFILIDIGEECIMLILAV